VLDPCRITRHPPAPLVEVIGSDRAWAGPLSAVVDALAGGSPVLVLSPERRIVRVADMASWHAAGGAVAAAGGRSVEVGHAWQPFAIEGAGARALLERGIELDLDPRHFAAGHAAATLCARAPVLLFADGAEAYTLFVATSYADWLTGWLEIAAVAVRSSAPPQSTECLEHGS
jgi:heterotetrameric sarcosine oxidase gamma subunit